MGDGFSKRFKKKKIDHGLLRAEYADVLPGSVSKCATQREVDAFQLFLFACDVSFMQKHPGDFSENNLAAEYAGLIRAIKFRGTYYKFDSDFNDVDQLFQLLVPKRAFRSG